MGVTHTTDAPDANPAATFAPRGSEWDATHLGTNDHLHTATADGGLIAPLAAAVTAAATPGADITAAGFLSFVTVTSANADHWVNLPAPVPGTVIILNVGATGYELRSSSPTTIAINGGTGAAAESAIAANSTIIAICISATAWKAFFLDADSDLAKVEAAA